MYVYLFIFFNFTVTLASNRVAFLRYLQPVLTSDLLSHLQSAEHGSDPPLQAVPPLVPLVDHDLKFAGSVGAVLSGQTAVLFVDQLQLSQALMNLPLERLKGENESHT